jgi:hypothetical protein
MRIVEIPLSTWSRDEALRINADFIGGPGVAPTFL